MANRVRRSAWAASLLGLVAATALGLSARTARTQVQTPVGFDPADLIGADGSFANRLMGGMNKPRVDPKGDWAEVIMANARWIVVQNAAGQQFPISYDGIQQFVVRWPTQLNLLTPGALLEVTGVDIGSNRIQTNHIDVYEGTARSMVSPTMLRLFGANRVLTPFDLDQTLYGGVIPFTGAESGIPPRIHAVGSVIGLDPLRVGVQGNNWVAVLPSDDGLDMTQVTTGTPAYVKRGDLAYIIPQAAGSKSLSVNRLILYKKVPFRAFVE